MPLFSSVRKSKHNNSSHGGRAIFDAGHIVRKTYKRSPCKIIWGIGAIAIAENQPTRPAYWPDTKSDYTPIYCLLVQLYNVVCCVVNYGMFLG
jgi:hypothetical protein